MDKSKTLTPRAVEMYALIKRYLESGQRQKDFCNSHDIKLATFQKWLHHYRKDQKKQTTSNSEFIPIKINQSPKKLFCGYTLEYPNGIILRISGHIDVSVVQTLLNQC